MGLYFRCWIPILTSVTRSVRVDVALALFKAKTAAGSPVARRPEQGVCLPYGRKQRSNSARQLQIGDQKTWPSRQKLLMGTLSLRWRRAAGLQWSISGPPGAGRAA